MRVWIYKGYLWYEFRKFKDEVVIYGKNIKKKLKDKI
jgi:hypothetical protein